MELDGAVKAAHEVLARADADAAYWMQQYKRCVEDIHNWVEASPLDEEESAPRYRLLQQTLQDTRHGLDYAVRTASDARQELANARQFYLAARTITPVSALHVAPASPSIPTVSTELSPAPFRIRPTPAASSSVQPVRTLETAPPAAVRRSLSVGSDVGSPVPPEIRRSTIPSVTVKRVGRDTVYLVPAKRARYPRAFKWDDNLMHHFPKDFTIPVCPLSTMWEYWVCGDPIAKYPPFRILVAPELEDVKTRRMLSSLRFVMLEIEARVLEHGAWLDKPSPRDAAAMLETVKESIAARPAAKRGELHPVEQLQWTSLGRITVCRFKTYQSQPFNALMHVPVLTAAAVVCRGCLSEHGVELLSHVVTGLDEYLNTFSKNWTVSRACEAGISRRGLEYLAARDPTWGEGCNAAYVAVKKNCLHVLQWLNECYPDRTLWGSLQGRCFINTAAERGHFGILKWLHVNRKEGCTVFAMSIVAAHGRLEMVQWLRQNRREGCTKQAMDDAAGNGHLAVVEWLHTNRDEGCTEDAMDDAAGNGHLEVLRFLHEHRSEGCTSTALNLAATHGHLEVVQWLCANRKEGQVGTALRAATENGHVAVAEWLYDEVRRQQRRSESTIRNAVRAATEAGHGNVAKLLERKLKRQRVE